MSAHGRPEGLTAERLAREKRLFSMHGRVEGHIFERAPSAKVVQ